MLWNFKRIIDYIEAVEKTTGNVNYELQLKKDRKDIILPNARKCTLQGTVLMRTTDVSEPGLLRTRPHKSLSVYVSHEHKYHSL